MGPLSRLIGHTIEHVRRPELILKVVDDLSAFASTLASQWRKTKLSAIDVSDESVRLHNEASKVTTPVLWQVLKAAMFACVMVLRTILARTLNDRVLADSKSR